MKARRISALGSAALAVAMAVLPGSAWAANSVPAAKALCNTAIARRLTSLSTVRANLDTAIHVSVSDRASLDNQIDATVAGLTNLKAAVNADTTLDKVRSDCKMVVSNYYVYAFLIPKVELVRASDRVEAAADVLKNLQNLLQSLVNDALGKGKNVTSAQGYVTDLGVKVSAATTSATAAATAVLPLVATGFPGNRPTIVTSQTALRMAAGDLHGALSAASNAVLALNALR